MSENSIGRATKGEARARREGAACARAYGLYHDNPYPPLTPEADAWEASYHATLHGEG